MKVAVINAIKNFIISPRVTDVVKLMFAFMEASAQDYPKVGIRMPLLYWALSMHLCNMRAACVFSVDSHSESQQV